MVFILMKGGMKMKRWIIWIRRKFWERQLKEINKQLKKNDDKKIERLLKEMDRNCRAIYRLRRDDDV